MDVDASLERVNIYTRFIIQLLCVSSRFPKTQILDIGIKVFIAKKQGDFIFNTKSRNSVVN